MGLRISGAAIAVFALSLFCSPAHAENRVALVIGNGAYHSVARLNNPINDASLMAETLSGLGFRLVGGGAQINLDKAGMDNAIASFGSQVVGANVALFYYAGHGLQIRNTNYLVPVSANPTREADVYVQMTDVAVVLSQMEGSGTKLNLLILDACRNNPFGDRGLRATDSGLAQIRAPEGTLISYATQPGNVAKDGSDGNSPYTKALAQTIKRGGLDIFQTFNEVGLKVKRETGGEQQPWVSSSPIDGTFYFADAPVQTAIAPPGTATPSLNETEQAWASIKDTKDLATVEAFIQRYGSSQEYADLAFAKRDKLKTETNQSAIAALSKQQPIFNAPAMVSNSGQRAVLYDEDPSEGKGKQYVGSVVWRTEQVKAVGGQKPDLAVRAYIDIPARRLKMTIAFRRNTDALLPASHTAELTFILPADFAGGRVDSVPGILMKANEQSRGNPLAALAVKVTEGFFLIGLSNVEADRTRNLQLLTQRGWFDVPLVYENQRRAIIAIEKGPPGEQAFSDAFAAWGQNSGPGPRIAKPSTLAVAKPVETPKPPANAANAPASGKVVFPAAISLKYSSEDAGMARMHTCVDQYIANKETNANGSMKWVQKGGGYYFECNKRFKGL